MMYMTSREFNQDLGRAKRESLHAPVIVTDRGKPKHVLLSFDEYQALHSHDTISEKAQPNNAYDFLMSLSHPDVADIDFELPVRSKAQRPPVDFGEL